MTGRLRASFDEHSLGIARRLHDWDVLGVYSIGRGPDDDDEYDDLVLPLRGWLEDGVQPEEMSALLVKILRRDYGLPYTDDFAELELTRCLHTWWLNKSTQPDLPDS
ncbi:hypothetical protein [uncultured Microbacterium sp.]|uniref:hypothetical protein n=1 Tax=uncultured Microbacterium sp. TaxID=191216 RepID=UPI0028D4527F|nr:hypothetical protein [uncultured Microbacterium sp.]